VKIGLSPIKGEGVLIANFPLLREERKKACPEPCAEYHFSIVSGVRSSFNKFQNQEIKMCLSF